jgi:hypothetical protein
VAQLVLAQLVQLPQAAEYAGIGSDWHAAMHAEPTAVATQSPEQSTGSQDTTRHRPLALQTLCGWNLVPQSKQNATQDMDHTVGSQVLDADRKRDGVTDTNCSSSAAGRYLGHTLSRALELRTASPGCAPLHQQDAAGVQAAAGGCDVRGARTFIDAQGSERVCQIQVLKAAFDSGEPTENHQH